MRSEKEMMEIILSTAKKDERIRAVYMNGSRTNPNVPKDIYQDYDIVFVVTETDSFLADKDWIGGFGKPLIVQEPDLNDNAWGEQHDFSRRYAWLILLEDGNRLDLVIEIKEEAQKNFIEDYHLKKPNEAQYRACCNNFLWCLNNVAKGIARDELPYAMEMYNCVVRNDLKDMISWYIGINTGFSVSVGKMGKHFKKFLTQELYTMYAQTYSDSSYENFWAAIFIACELFRSIAPEVADYFGYTYNWQDDKNMATYLNRVKNNDFMQ